jgi:PEP-CTERM motif
MKKIIALMSVLGLGTLGSFGQGQIALYSVGSSSYNIQTNNTGAINPGNPTQGNIAGANQYFFAVLYTTNTAVTAPADNPTLSAWSIAPFSATNYTLGAGQIRGQGGAAGAAVTGIPLNPGPAYYNGTNGASIYFMVIGWSASLGGSGAASTIVSEATSGNWVGTGYFGYSAVSEDVSGNTSTASLNAVNLFGNQTGLSGSLGNYGLSGGFVLNPVVVTPTPEPGTMALAALGGASLLLFRRRK